jgi:hypothetical protein
MDNLVLAGVVILALVVALKLLKWFVKKTIWFAILATLGIGGAGAFLARLFLGPDIFPF